jgi:hypothetical protein
MSHPARRAVAQNHQNHEDQYSPSPAHDAQRASGRLGRTELRLCMRLGASEASTAGRQTRARSARNPAEAARRRSALPGLGKCRGVNDGHRSSYSNRPAAAKLVMWTRVGFSRAQNWGRWSQPSLAASGVRSLPQDDAQPWLARAMVEAKPKTFYQVLESVSCM